MGSDRFCRATVATTTSHALALHSTSTSPLTLLISSLQDCSLGHHEAHGHALHSFRNFFFISELFNFFFLYAYIVVCGRCLQSRKFFKGRSAKEGSGNSVILFGEISNLVL